MRGGYRWWGRLHVLGAGMLGGMMGGVGVLHWEDWRKAWKLQVENEQEEWGKESSRPLGRYDFVQAIDLVAPSVVKISVAHEDFGFFGLHGVLESSGSGFVLTSDGKIATNAHVVAGPQAGRVSGKLLVTLHDGRTFPGKVSGMDVLSDLALVEVDTGFPLTPVRLSTTPARAGEWVIALGSPLNYRNSATAGIISSEQRERVELGLAEGGPPTYIQTDAAVNVGNSGGPLISLDGEVLGITTYKANEDGISFALPADYARGVLEQLMAFGKIRRPFLGLKLVTLTPLLRDELVGRGRELPKEIGKHATHPEEPIGILVHEVMTGSPADLGGLRSGDVIIGINGKSMLSTGEFGNLMRGNGGTAITMGILRGSSAQPLTLHLTPSLPAK
mmetsp:Transcript_16972/g.35219  ORF Transcript_16972/g.35219 Transcript_16972/m.35219 type:complete len:389 (+) Transcript_16972:5869-7035(+)